MDTDYQPAGTRTSCCDDWWANLTPVQRMWLHSHLWDLEILAGWASDIMVQAVKSHHSQRVYPYGPTHTNGTYITPEARINGNSPWSKPNSPQ